MKPAKATAAFQAGPDRIAAAETRRSCGNGGGDLKSMATRPHRRQRVRVTVSTRRHNPYLGFGDAFQIRRGDAFGGGPATRRTPDFGDGHGTVGSNRQDGVTGSAA
jgi:hypothetical protein